MANSTANSISPAVSNLERIGVGIDTARYGHRVSFLRPDRQPAAKPLTVLESQAGYRSLQERLELLHQQHPLARFHVRIDAAGQYAANLEHFLRRLELPITLSIGEPKRNKDYQKAHFPKRTTDDTESQAMARFAVVEQPVATREPSPQMTLLHEVAGRLQAHVKQTTRAVNRLHNLMARVFPELATLADDFSASWVLHLLDKYPDADKIAQARLASLEKIPFVAVEKAQAVHQAAAASVGSLRGEIAQTLVRNLVAEVRHCLNVEQNMRNLLDSAFADLPPSGHSQLITIPGVGVATAAVLTAKIVDIDRFASADHLVGYFGIFPQEDSSGVDKQGNPRPLGTLSMSPKGNDLVRHYLWNAARVGIRFNPVLRALYARLKAKGKRGDVALGHCMRKLLHLAFALWKTNRPFDAERASPAPSDIPMSPSPADSIPADSVPADSVPADATPSPAAQETAPENKKAAGHTRDIPAKKVVTTADSNLNPEAKAVNPTPTPPAPPAADRPHVDFAFLRSQVTLEKALSHLGFLDRLRGRTQQRRGACPVHSQPDDRTACFSAHLGKNVFQCFHPDCAAHGNVLDLWAAVHRLPLYEAALHMAKTFAVPRNREEEPVS